MFASVAEEFLPEAWVGDGGHSLGPLQQGQAGEVDDPVLRRHILDHGTGGGDHAARRDAGDDVGLQCAVLLLVCGIEADEALSALRPEGTLQEIQLPADAGELPGTGRSLRFPGP